MGIFRGKNDKTMQHRDPRAASPRQYPPTTLSIWHLLYLVVMQGFGGLIIAGGLNFAIAYAMYHHSNKPVELWNISNNTLAGDAGVTVIVECIACWIIEGAMVSNDVRSAALGIRPIAWGMPRRVAERGGRPTMWQRFWLWYISLEGMDLLQPRIPLGIRFKRLVGSALRGFLFCIPIFCLWWPVGVGILAGIGHHVGGHEYSYDHYPEPQVFKLIFGGTMALVVVPIMAAMVLLAMDAARALPESVAGPAGTWQGPDKQGAVDATRVEVPAGAAPVGLANGHSPADVHQPIV